MSHIDDNLQLVVTYKDKKISDLKLIIVNVQNDGKLTANNVILHLPSLPEGILETSVSYRDSSKQFYGNARILRIANELFPSEEFVVKICVTGFTEVGVKEFLQEVMVFHDMGLAKRRRIAP